MGPPRIYAIRETGLGKAIRSIRRRLGLGQIGLVIALTGRPHAGEVSRWEAGRKTPSLKMLVGLLRFAESPAEREPILEALRAQGIDGLLSNLHRAGLIAPADHQTSIHPAGADCNLVPQIAAGPPTAPKEFAPAPEDSQVLPDGVDSSSHSFGIAAGPAQAQAGAGPAPPGEQGS